MRQFQPVLRLVVLIARLRLGLRVGGRRGRRGEHRLRVDGHLRGSDDHSVIGQPYISTRLEIPEILLWERLPEILLRIILLRWCLVELVRWRTVELTGHSVILRWDSAELGWSTILIGQLHSTKHSSQYRELVGERGPEPRPADLIGTSAVVTPEQTLRRLVQEVRIHFHGVRVVRAHVIRCFPLQVVSKTTAYNTKENIC